MSAAEGGLEFLDSNVLVYAVDSSAGTKGETARALIRRLWANGSASVSTQVLQEFYVTATRKILRPVPAGEAKEEVANFGQWHLHRPELEDILSAIDLNQSSRISFWDAMILRSAERLGCSVVWSEDLSPGQRYRGVPVRNPFAP